MEELRKFQRSTFDTIARRRSVEDQDDSRVFQDAESARSGNSYVSSRPVSFPPQPIPEGMLSRPIGMPSRREGSGHTWHIRKRFCIPVASSSAPYPQELNPWSSESEEPLHPSIVEKSEKQTPVKDQRYQSGPSAKNSVIPSEGVFLRIMGQTKNNCRFQILISTNSIHQQRLLVRR